MKTYQKFLSVGLIGILIFLILPGYWKIFSFLIPAIFLSLIYAKRGFNWYIFLGVSFLYLLFPSSLLTLDSGNPFNITATVNYIENLVKIGVVIFCIVIPIIILVASIWAYINGNVESGTAGLIKVILMIIIISIALFFGTMFGWKLFNLEILKPIFNFFWALIKGIGNIITNIISWFIEGINPSYANELRNSMSLSDDIELLSVMSSPKSFWLTITSIYPVILCLICIFMGICYGITKKEPGKLNDDTQRFTKPLSLNLSFLVFLLIIIISAFILYLTYSFESFLNYQNLGFFTIYLLITSIACIFLVLGIGSTTRLNFKDTFFGIIFGFSLLFIYLNMFTQVKTLDLLETEYPILIQTQILNQFLFVAPTESLLFHVFLPGLVIFYYLQKTKTKEDLDKLRSEIQTLEVSAEIHKQVKDVKRYAKTMQILNKKKIKLSRIEKEPGIPQSKLKNINFIIYFAFCIFFNCIFSILHFIKSGLSFELFWSSGLGFLYMSSGIIITMIGYRFGWLSAILTHAIYNALMLFLILI